MLTFKVFPLELWQLKRRLIHNRVSALRKVRTMKVL